MIARGNGMESNRVRIVAAGDKLPFLAMEVYGDARLWRPIAEANDIDDPLQFPEPKDVGRLLLIP